MASVGGQTPSLKRRDSSVTREGDQLIITPLGAGNEVGRSCVYMSYKGKTVLVCCPSQLLIIFIFDFLIRIFFILYEIQYVSVFGLVV